MAMLEGMVILAIVGGMIAGAISGRVCRRTPWTVLAILSFFLLIVGWAFPFAAIFLCSPAAVFIAIFVSFSEIVRAHFFKAQAVGGSQAEAQWPEARPNLVSHILYWIAGTYGFWAAVSLVNFDLLSFLAIPPVILSYPNTIGKFLPFILPPLAVAVAVGVAATTIYLLIRKGPCSRQYLAPFIFNACALSAFFVSAEAYSSYLISQSLAGHVPHHFYRSSFVDSVRSYHTFFRTPHASFDEEGETYQWSYSERKFFAYRSGRL
ncbi:MAG: hypothetical protein V4724_04705 [Pseudomonadota bacterium]